MLWGGHGIGDCGEGLREAGIRVVAVGRAAEVPVRGVKDAHAPRASRRGDSKCSGEPLTLLNTLSKNTQCVE